MLSPVVALLGILAGFTIFYVWAWWRGAAHAAATPGAPSEAKTTGAPTPFQLVLGFITNFFDTLGIGSFAPTTAVFKFLKMVPDRLIPGTLNVGHTLPTITQAFIYTVAIAVDPTTLVLMIAAAVAGAWLGAGVVAGWPKRKVQIGMGLALLVAAALFTWRNLGGTGTETGTTGLSGLLLALGLIGNFALGALMTLGIGMYAPCMILVGMLGMNAATAFPIMMGSCAFLMPVASSRFVQKQAYSLRPALGLAIGGIPGVLLAAYIFTSLPIYWVRWLVVVVVIIAATMMLRSAAKGE
ncbi:MAG TPA: sulfite exporter TauE/SafE family protein [Vicinamibacterales bacterium]|nr:sulfite exporter TauE/SafE family protein [Vicinamibacterales bacterium]